MGTEGTIYTFGTATGIQKRQFVHSVNICALKKGGKTVKETLKENLGKLQGDNLCSSVWKAQKTFLRKVV